MVKSSFFVFLFYRRTSTSLHYFCISVYSSNNSLLLAFVIPMKFLALFIDIFLQEGTWLSISLSRQGRGSPAGHTKCHSSPCRSQCKITQMALFSPGNKRKAKAQQGFRLKQSNVYFHWNEFLFTDCTNNRRNEFYILAGILKITREVIFQLLIFLQSKTWTSEMLCRLDELI